MIFDEKMERKYRTYAPFLYSAPGMGNNLVVKVHYRLGSRNC